VELSEVMEMFYSVPANAVATNLRVPGATVNRISSIILVNFNFNSHLWLDYAVVNSTKPLTGILP
jgi:hypothetical protein